MAGKPITLLADTIASYVKACGKRSILQTCPQSMKGVNLAELKFAPQLEGDVLHMHTSPMSEITSYFEGIAKEGRSFKPAFENPDSAFAKYYADVQSKIFKPRIGIGPLKAYIFNNADKLNVSKSEYWELVDTIAANVKKEITANPNGLRKEFVENSDKIHKWAEIFSTQHFENGKNIYHKFYDKKMYNQAVKEYIEFVEKLTGKKVLIGCTSRMNFPISALGCFNNPKAYKDIDYILLGHGKNSSLITDTKNPLTWRFSDNDKSIWEFIEQKVPKGKKVLVFCCETDGLRKAGKTTTDMLDRKGQRMYSIGNEVVNDFNGENKPVKICQSGVIHIIGQMSEQIGTSAKSSGIGATPTLGKYATADFSLAQVDNPKTIMYDLDYSKYMIENL